MNNLQVFNNEQFGEVRTTVIDGEPYFMLADVCRILDIKNTRDAKTRLNQKGVVITDTLTNGGTQQATFISESNLYKLVFTSRKREAEAFTEWVTSEVLPSIRKPGGYLGQTEGTTDQLVVMENNQIVTTSKKVAEVFGKRHDKLIFEIDRIYGDLIADNLTA